MGHTFTQDERDQLEAGLSIECDDFISRKTGNKFKAKLRYGAKDDGTTGIIFDFDK